MNARPAMKAPIKRAPIVLLDGSIGDLADFAAADVDIAEMASSLSKIVRWSGRHRGAGISVAQHCVMGADALFRETGDAIAAGYFLVHDGHEYLIGDMTRPTVKALDADIAAALADIGIGGDALSGIATNAARRLKDRLDTAIHAALGLPPIGAMPLYRRMVAEMDERMCLAESRELYGAGDIPLVRHDLPPPKLVDSLAKRWPPALAEEKYLERLSRYLNLHVRPA
jgi:hypothetical protein